MNSVTTDPVLWEKVEKSLDSIRPFLRADGGDIEVIRITEEHELQVRMLGACENCKMSFTTMKAGVEATIKRDVPEIETIRSVNTPS